jgi:hypothetical protein
MPNSVIEAIELRGWMVLICVAGGGIAGGRLAGAPSHDDLRRSPPVMSRPATAVRVTEPPPNAAVAEPAPGAPGVTAQPTTIGARLLARERARDPDANSDLALCAEHPVASGGVAVALCATNHDHCGGCGGWVNLYHASQRDTEITIHAEIREIGGMTSMGNPPEVRYLDLGSGVAGFAISGGGGRGGWLEVGQEVVMLRNGRWRRVASILTETSNVASDSCGGDDEEASCFDYELRMEPVALPHHRVAGLHVDLAGQGGRGGDRAKRSFRRPQHKVWTLPFDESQLRYHVPAELRDGAFYVPR